MAKTRVRQMPRMMDRSSGEGVKSAIQACKRESLSVSLAASGRQRDKKRERTHDKDRTGSVAQPEGEVGEHLEPERRRPTSEDDGTECESELLDDDKTGPPACSVTEPAVAEHDDDLQDVWNSEMEEISIVELVELRAKEKLTAANGDGVEFTDTKPLCAVRVQLSLEEEDDP